MALFKILKGDEANISTDITPFHEGWCYVTHSGYFYIDLNIGTVENPNNQRIKLNAKEAEALVGYDIASVLNDNAVEIPTSAAVYSALQNYATKDSLAPVATSGLIDDLSLGEDTELILDGGDAGIRATANEVGGETIEFTQSSSMKLDENSAGGETAIIN